MDHLPPLSAPDDPGEVGERGFRARSEHVSTPPSPARSASAPTLGVIGFDSAAPENSTSRVVVSEAGRAHFRRNLYVGIRDADQRTEFLGRVVAGPFHTPRKDGDYVVHGVLEVLGELTEGERLVATMTRPRPNAEVRVFPDERLRHFLRIEGDLYLGRLSGHDGVAVHAASDNKNFFPRNVGVFGTVGSGKSNTAQVLMEEAIAAGWAVVLIDVEGEYVRMNEPTDDEKLSEVLEGHGLAPRGIQDFRVYVPTTGTTVAERPIPFKIPVSTLDPEVVADLLEFTEGERRVFETATEHAIRSAAPPTPGTQRDRYRPFDLQTLLDGLMEGASVVAGQPTLRLLPYAKPHDIAAAGTLRSKLRYLGKTGMLDWNETANTPELPIEELLASARLSVLDVSGTDDRSRNLAIAYVLQSLFDQVIQTPVGKRMPSGRPRPPLLVMIEEVHTFVSRAAAPNMRATLDSLQTISRRGRKRWMALGLVSQQPNHVPDEIFELANTRFIHQMKSQSNLEPVKATTGNVDETLWETIPSMGPGQTLLTGAIFHSPLFVNMRPAHSRRMLTT